MDTHRGILPVYLAIIGYLTELIEFVFFHSLTNTLLISLVCFFEVLAS